MYTEDFRIFSSNKQQIRLHGISWFGFNNDGQAPDGLWTGQPLASDFATVVARMRCLGFNAVRLPFSFKDLDPAKGTARDLTFDTGQLPSATDIAKSCGMTDLESISRATLPYKPVRNGTRCNDYLPNKSVWARFVYAVQFFARNGFYVLIDNHLREDKSALEDKNAWLGAYVKLCAELCQDGSTKSRLMVDLLNEPGGDGLRWEPGAHSVADFYLSLMDRLETVAPLLYFVEGTGQDGIGCNWGDGFCTDDALIKQNGLSDPRPFFDALAKKPYKNRVVLSPHCYGPAVTNAKTGWSGADLAQRLTRSFGALTKAGYKGEVYAVAPGEFGSRFEDANDGKFMADLSAYFRNVAGPLADGKHHSVQSWFYWCWNDNSGDTGGLVGSDWQTLQPRKLAFLRELGL